MEDIVKFSVDNAFAMLSSLEQLKENIEIVKEKYIRYLEARVELEDCDKEIKAFKIKNEGLVSKLDELKEYAHSHKLKLNELKKAQKFFKANPEVKKYYVNTLRAQCMYQRVYNYTCFYDNEYGEYFFLNQGNKKFILDLYRCQKIDVTNYDRLFINFLKNAIDKRMLEITPDDLPLLMAIKEELNYIDYIDENDFMAKGLWGTPYELKREFRYAKMLDDKVYVENHTPFMLYIDTRNKAIKDLEKVKETLSKEEYLTKYYEMKMLFGNNIEKMYLEADEENKKYIIEAYYNIASSKDENKHFRTASPIINIELLKEKYKVKVR